MADIEQEADLRAFFSSSPETFESPTDPLSADHQRQEQEARGFYNKSPQMFDRPAKAAAPQQGAPPAASAPAPAAAASDPSSHAYRVQKWAEEVRADPEIGTPEALSLARGLVKEYGDQALKDALNSSGWGSHPALVRLLVRIARGRR